MLSQVVLCPLYAHPDQNIFPLNCFYYLYVVRCLSSQLLGYRQQMKSQKVQSRYSDLKRHPGSHVETSSYLFSLQQQQQNSKSKSFKDGQMDGVNVVFLVD